MNAHGMHADPESFVRGGPILTGFFSWWREGGSKKALKAGHHRPTSEMAFRWRVDDGPTLNKYWLGSIVIFQGIWTSIAGNPIILWFFRGGWRGGGGSRSPVPSLDPPMHDTFKMHGLYRQSYVNLKWFSRTSKGSWPTVFKWKICVVIQLQKC